MRTSLAAVIALGLAAVLGGCEGLDTGTDARLRVAGGTFERGELRCGGGGPEVVSLELGTNTIFPGQRGKPLEGALAAGSTAAAIGLAGDVGWWTVPAGIPEVLEPGLPTYDVALEISRDLLPGAYQLAVCAVDDAERFGKARTAELTAALGDEPHPLVVSLAWDTEADLDLHVVDPLGNEIYKRDISSAPPPTPGQPPSDAGAASAGVLDFDSNAGCVVDGRRRENVIWKGERPSGHYLVRVDAFSLCGASATRWTVEVRALGQLLAHSAGMSLPSDTAMPHDRGAGVLAAELDLP